MRRIKLACLAYLAIIIALNACSSGKSAFEHGNYYEAVITSVNRLRKNDDHKKSIETLRQAYPLAVSFYEDRAKTTLSSNAEFKWTSVVESYSAINVMYDEIRRCPGALKVIPNPVNYYAKLDEAKKNAAEENYSAGIRALTAATREKAKVAYTLFKKTNEFVPGYKDVQKMMETALWNATVKVVMEPIPVAAKNISVSAEFFDDKVSEYLHTGSLNEFVKFYTRKEAQTLKLNPDHIIKIEFDEFAVGQVYMNEKETKLERDSVVVGSYVAQSGNTTSGGKTGAVVGTAGVVAGTIPGGNNNSGNTNPPANTGGNTNTGVNTTSGNTGGNTNTGNTGSNTNTGNTGGNTNTGNTGVNTNTGNTGGNTNTGNTGGSTNTGNTGGNTNTGNTGSNTNTGNTGGNTNAGNTGGNTNPGNTGGNNNNSGNSNSNNNNNNNNNSGSNNSNTSNNNSGNNNSGGNTTTPEDTVKVTVCHVPPGNEANRHTLVINRSALQAHLGHGDTEGPCPAADDKKPKPKNDKKPGGHSSINNSKKPNFIASSDNDLNWLAYEETSELQIDTVKVYTTVKATFYYYKKTTTSKGVISFRIIDAKTNAILSVEKMPGEYVWVSEWATFNGDERALSPEQLQLTKQREKIPPSAQDLFIEFTRPIYDQLITKINNFYKNY